MDIEKLRTFIAVAHSGNFSIAADEVYLTPSAVSKHIAALEHEFGASLFDRMPQSICLTPKGELCLTYAERIVSEYDDLLYQLSGSVTLTVLSIPFQFTIIPLVDKFTKLHPNITISLRDGHGRANVKAVECGKAELAFTGSPYSKSSLLECHTLLSNPLGVILPANHPLVGNKKISI